MPRSRKERTLPPSHSVINNRRRARHVSAVSRSRRLIRRRVATRDTLVTLCCRDASELTRDRTEWVDPRDRLRSVELCHHLKTLRPTLLFTK